MTVDQIIALTATIAGILATIGTVTISIYNLRFQGQQELKRDEKTQLWQEKERAQARAWSIEDRDTVRLWKKLDDQVEIRKSYLTKHKDIVDEYIKTVLNLFDRMLAKKTGLTQEALNDMTNPLVEHLVDQSNQVAFHVAVFNDSQLKEEFALFYSAWFEFVKVVDKKDIENTVLTALTLEARTRAASVTRLMENIIVKDIQNPQ